MENMGSLLAQNRAFDHNYGLMPKDLDMVNEMIGVIELTRANDPIAGDRIVCAGPNKTYNFGHLEKLYIDDFSSICTQPYIPFTSIHEEDGKVSLWFNTSGGYWLNCIDRDMYWRIGTCMKTFCAWGNNGACAGGAVNFQAEVNVWKIFMEGIY